MATIEERTLSGGEQTFTAHGDDGALVAIGTYYPKTKAGRFWNRAALAEKSPARPIYGTTAEAVRALVEEAATDE